MQCPLCGARLVRFEPFNGRAGALCPRCGSLERHRAAWLYLTRHTSLTTAPLRVLHVAPEPMLEARLRALPALDYVTGDLLSGTADLVLDLTDVQAPDGSFDVVLCSHVLEHVSDDRRAMSEIRRLLRPGGWAWLVVPFDPDLDVTFEDPTIVSPEERRRAFGQEDHVRYYAGGDFERRLRSCGLSVERVEAAAGRDASRYGLRGPGVRDWAVIARPA